MLYESSSLDSILGSAIIVGLKIIRTSSEHYTTDAFSNVYIFLWNISHFRRTLILNRCALQTRKVAQIYSEMNTCYWWWDKQDQLPAGAMIVPVICASDGTPLTNVSGDQHAWPLYLKIGNIRKDICRTPMKRAWILVELIPWPPKSAKNTDEAWHSAVGTELSPLWNLDITGAGFKWDCADGFQRR